jgi:DNA-binding NarL/FixJ family response regulator
MGKKVLIVEDDVGTARSFAYSISGVPSLSLVAIVNTVSEAKAFLSAQSIDVVLVDLGLPDGSGLEVIRFASALAAPTQILVCTVFGDEKNVIAAIEAGASGYVLKDALTSNVASDIETLLSGGSALSPSVAKLLLTRLRTPLQVGAGAPAAVAASQSHGSTTSSAGPFAEQVQLSAREHEVLSMIARGCTYAETANALKISPETVSTHLRNTYKKLSVHSRTEAVYEAGRMGILKII